MLSLRNVPFDYTSNRLLESRKSFAETFYVLFAKLKTLNYGRGTFRMHCHLLTHANTHNGLIEAPEKLLFLSHVSYDSGPIHFN